MGIREASQITTHPLRGQLFENLIIANKLKTSRHTGQRQDFWFYRDSHGIEVDLISSHARGLSLTEIKSGKTLASEALFNIKKERQLIPGENHSTVIYGGEGDWMQSGTRIQGWREALSTPQ